MIEGFIDNCADLAKFLATARHTMGMSIQDVHRATGVPYTTIQRIETNSVSPTFDTFMPLLKCYGLVMHFEPKAE